MSEAKHYPGGEIINDTEQNENASQCLDRDLAETAKAAVRSRGGKRPGRSIWVL